MKGNPLKRPLSITFILIYCAGFIFSLVINAFFSIDFMDFLYGFLISIIIFCIPLIVLFLIFLVKNLKISRKRSLWFGVGALICVVIVPAVFLSTGLVKDQFTRAQKNFNEKKYETAIQYYDYVIRKSEETDAVETSKKYKESAQKNIDDAKTLEKNGDIYFEYGLYRRAEEEYRKAAGIYPFLDGIKDKIEHAVSMKEKYGENASEENYILFDESLKFNYETMFPQWWGKVKACEPQLASFGNFILEQGEFFESANMLKISGKLKGKPELGRYLESDYGLFVFIAAYVIDNEGNIKWTKEGYLSGDSPYLREGEIRDFSLISTLSKGLQKDDRIVIAAYVKGSMIILTDIQNPENPNADRNVFAFYMAQIKDI